MITKMKSLVLVLTGMILLATSLQAETRIATVDMARVFNGYWKKQKAEEALKERDTDLSKELEGMKDTYRKTEEEYKKLVTAAEDQALTPEEREKRKKVAQTKFQELKANDDEIKTFVSTNSERMTKQKQNSIEGILKDIREVIKAKATTAGYTLVINKTAETGSGIPVVFYASDDTDITDAVLKQLNSTTPADFKPAEKK